MVICKVVGKKVGVCVYDEGVERMMRERLWAHEAVRDVARRELAQVWSMIEEEDRVVTHVSFILSDYRRGCGLPPVSNDLSPVLAREYSHMGPTELVQYWADNHEGEVVVKELAWTALRAGIFSNYHGAFSSIYMVLKRKPFDKIGAGRFRRRVILI